MNSSEEFTERKKTLRRTFLACAIGTSSFISATFSLTGLQSSMNVRDSLGTTSMVIRVTTGIFGSLFIAPFVVKRYGAKIGLIASEITDLLFTVANFYPNWYTMLTASAISGLGSNMIWVASGTILQSVATKSAKDKEGSVETQKLFGKFFGIMAVGQMTGNAITQLVLRFAFATPESTRDISHNFNSSNTEHFTNQTTDLSSCASSDCPEEYAFLSETPKFQSFTPNQNAVYLLLSLYLLMQIAAICIHAFILPTTPSSRASKISEKLNSSSHDPLLPKITSPWFDALHSAKAVFLYLTSAQGLLTSTVHLMYGMEVSFVWSEFNRAFVSCVIGVEQVGACSVIVDFLYFVTSTVISRIAPRVGLVSIMITGMLYDVTNYTVSLSWIPTTATLFLPYVFSAMFGISHGIRRNTAFLAVSRYSQDRAIGFSAQAIVVCIGEVITFAWSTPLCVYIKMYVMIALAILNTVCWGIAEYRLRTGIDPSADR